MIILDTNSLYYAYGLSECIQCKKNNILKIIDKNPDVFITCITLDEIINKFHKHANKVRRIFTFTKVHKINIINEKRQFIENNLVNYLSKIKQKELDAYYKETIKSKIKYESSICSLFLTLLSLSYLFFYIKKIEKDTIKQ